MARWLATPMALVLMVFTACVLLLHSLFQEADMAAAPLLGGRGRGSGRGQRKEDLMEERKVLAMASLQLGRRVQLSESGPSENQEDARLRSGLIRPKVLSWEPKVVQFDNFLSDHECEHLIGLAKDQLLPSTVIDEKTGLSVADSWRSSSGCFLSDQEEKSPIVAGILHRISTYSYVPVENGEPMQILRYRNGEAYKPHEDYIDPPADSPPGGERVITFLLYLTGDIVGGETWFPNATGTCQCGGASEAGLSVQPKRGRALMFFNMRFDGGPDPVAMHAGCQVLEGEKWSATKWLLTEPWPE